LDAEEIRRSGLNIVLIALSVMAVAPIEMSITPIRGDAVNGRLVELTSKQLVVQTPSGIPTFAADALLAAKVNYDLPTNPPRSTQVETVVTLVDGSVLHATNYAVES